MPDEETVGQSTEDRGSTALAKADLACAFGPSFFIKHLGRFVRDQCPDAGENLPRVQVRLADGETLDVCHIIAVSPRWVVLAIHETANHRDGMAVEVVPFETIRRVGIVRRRAEDASIGFSQTQPAEIITSEALLRAAMSPHPGKAG